MRIYPKGCRYHVVFGGKVYPLAKTDYWQRISNIMPTNAHHSDGACVVVQPRGKKKWWLFASGEHFNEINFVATAHEPDSLIMRALLGGLTR